MTDQEMKDYVRESGRDRVIDLVYPLGEKNNRRVTLVYSLHSEDVGVEQNWMIMCDTVDEPQTKKKGWSHWNYGRGISDADARLILKALAAGVKPNLEFSMSVLKGRTRRPTMQ